MTTGTVIVVGMGLAFAGVGLYVATRHEPTPRERLIDAVISPVEAASGAVSTGLTLAPFLPLIVLVLLAALVGLVILALPSAALGNIAAKRLG